MDIDQPQISQYADLVEEVEELMDVPNTPDVNDVPIGNINLEHQYSKLEISGAPEPIGPNLVTLSLLPKTQWQNLMHIEALKVSRCFCLALQDSFACYNQKDLNWKCSISPSPNWVTQSFSCKNQNIRQKLWHLKMEVSGLLPMSL